ncbi:MAG: TetR/AcrR family transcriptional regulator [Candidatus Aminicenantales bacterium]
MTKEKHLAREKIVTATIECIEEHGLQALTIRSIASKAGVNSAAINYYFNTKEKLVEEALDRTLEEFKKIPEETLQVDALDPQARLRAFFNALFDGLIRWPRIARAHLQSPLFEANYGSRFVDTFNSFQTDLLHRLEEMSFGSNEKNLRARIIQSISAVLIPGLMPGLFRYFSGLDFTDPEARRSYIDDLVTRLVSSQ